MLIGELLTELYGLKKEDLQAALRLQDKLGGYLGQVLIQTGHVTETQLLTALARQLGLELYDREQTTVDPAQVDRAAAGALDISYLCAHGHVPLSADQQTRTMTFATSDPLDTALLDYVVKQVGYTPKPVLAPEQAIKELARLYAPQHAENFVLLHVDDSPERLKEMAFEAPVIKFLNALLSRAVELHASDVHVEPMGNTYRVRFRIDGILHDMEHLEEGFYLAVVSRIKLLSALDIAEKRLPQDGKFSTRIAAVLLDIRVSSIPMVKGEGVVMRLLYRERLSFETAKLGLEPDHARTLESFIVKPNGMLLVTGPTGSGKTTTLYSVLTKLNNEERKIVTVEDPVEYQLDGINQIQVKSDIGLGFAESLRSILRHDPDIIMVGEIRDSVTAEISIQSSLTGHLVLSTLHTNDAPSSLFRLMDMGVANYLINASVLGALAQRIVRRNCPLCSKPTVPSADVMKAYGIEDIARRYASVAPVTMSFMRGEGCPACAHTGYKGRMAIFEVMEYTEEAKDSFLHQRSLDALRGLLVDKYGFRTLREDGLLKAMRGLTTIEEVLRVA